MEPNSENLNSQLHTDVQNTLVDKQTSSQHVESGNSGTVNEVICYEELLMVHPGGFPRKYKSL